MLCEDFLRHTGGMALVSSLGAELDHNPYLRWHHALPFGNVVICTSDS
jgi:hypothetical protein